MLASITQLNGSNWVSWSESMTVLLKTKSLWNLVDGTARVPTVDTLTLGIDPTNEQLSRRDRQEAAMDLYSSRKSQAVGVIASALNLVLRKASKAATSSCPKDLWDKLHLTYGAAKNEQGSFLKQLANSKVQSPGECIRDHHNYLLGLYNDMELENYIVPYHERCENLVSKLQPEWEDVVDKCSEHFDDRDPMDRTLTDLQWIVNKFVTKSLQRERSKKGLEAAKLYSSANATTRGLAASDGPRVDDDIRKELNELRALIATSSGGGSKTKTKDSSKSKPRRSCDNCGDDQHLARNCRESYSKEYIKKLGERYQPTHVTTICERHEEYIKKPENGKTARETEHMVSSNPIITDEVPSDTIINAVELSEETEYCMSAQANEFDESMPHLIDESDSDDDDHRPSPKLHHEYELSSKDNTPMPHLIEGSDSESDVDDCSDSDCSTDSMPSLHSDYSSDDSDDEVYLNSSAFKGSHSNSENQNSVLFLDSGASSHMLGDHILLENSTKCNRQIIQLDGSTVNANSIGEIVL